ncbi:MAG: 3-oxoacyl-ACP reductase FabG [Xanthomonadales bacterium]|nr:3-oxoacyl-ACP reductase FabG [Xanthomonadales bacterium]
MENTLQGQVALVTGATRGIGAAISDTLAQMGARVIGTATSAAGSAAITQRLSALNPDCRGAVLNVTDAHAVEELVQSLAGSLGAPTILVNNAGITRDQLLLRMKDADWDDVMVTNLKSIFRLSRACLRGMMKARSGRIISISSVVASMGNAGQVNYAAAKAGIEGFSRSLAREVGSRAITVNVIAPGFIDTDMTRSMDQAQRDELLQGIALQRLGQPQDIAAAVAFLASPAGGYITGHTLHVNGGMYM